VKVARNMRDVGVVEAAIVMKIGWVVRAVKFVRFVMAVKVAKSAMIVRIGKKFEVGRLVEDGIIATRRCAVKVGRIVKLGIGVGGLTAKVCDLVLQVLVELYHLVDESRLLLVQFDETPLGLRIEQRLEHLGKGLLQHLEDVFGNLTEQNGLVLSDALLDRAGGATEKVDAFAIQFLPIANQRAEQLGLLKLPRLVEEEQLGGRLHVLQEAIQLLFVVPETPTQRARKGVAVEGQG
jgi:hypothetical protein